MNESDKKNHQFKNYEEMAEFWENHSVADYWEKTEPAEFEISPNARRRYLVALDKELLMKLQKLARRRGLTLETMANLLIEQRMMELETQA
jgi:hypothetical protein